MKPWTTTREKSQSRSSSAPRGTYRPGSRFSDRANRGIRLRRMTAENRRKTTGTNNNNAGEEAMQYDTAMLERAMAETVAETAAFLQDQETPAFVTMAQVELRIDQWLRDLTRKQGTAQRLPKKSGIRSILKEQFAAAGVAFRGVRNLQGFVNTAAMTQFVQCKAKRAHLLSARHDVLCEAKVESLPPFVRSLPPA